MLKWWAGPGKIKCLDFFQRAKVAIEGAELLCWVLGATDLHQMEAPESMNEARLRGEIR